MSNLAHQLESYTYEDYSKLPNDTRAEIINGAIYDMSPAPSSIHQAVLKFLSGEFYVYLKGKTCEHFISPFDVFLNCEEANLKDCDTVVQPDLLVICDETKIIKQGCLGAPDFITEILSPSSKHRDYVTKLNLYMESGVREYWIVDPDKRKVTTYFFSAEKELIDMETYSFTQLVKSRLFDGLEIDFTESIKSISHLLTEE